MFNLNIKVGRLTRDPEHHESVGQNNVPLTKFSIAVDKDIGEGTDFFNVVTWRRLAEVCAEHLTKGQLVLVVGRDQISTWDKDDGTKGYSHEIVAERVKFLSPKSSKKSTGQSAQTDVPF